MKVKTGSEALERLEVLLTWAKAYKKKIDDDERFHYKPALVQVNAPLALEQVSMKARHLVYEDVIGIIEGHKEPVMPT